MDYRSIAKNSDAYNLLSRDAKSGRVAHAYLISSSDEKVSNALVSAFISDCVFGGERTAEDRISRNACADIVRLPHGEKVLTDDIKEITDTVYFTPTELPRKFYLVERAETMNPASQNKLLKVLEEPPALVTIILMAKTTKTLLPTVLSRVKTVEIDGVKEQEMMGLLTEKYGENNLIYLASALSGGSVSKAEEVISQKKYGAIFDAVIDAFKYMKTSRNILQYSARLIEFKDELSQVVDIIELVLADAMLASEGVRDRLRFKNAVKDIIDISRQYNSTVVLRLAPALRRARERLEFNGNAQSVLDELLFSTLEVKAKCQKS